MPKRILLADDSITIQKVVELTFSDGDYEVVATNNGAKAIQRLAEVKPDIVLSDIIMPEKNGYEVCEYVKSHPEFRHIPVILLTGTFEPFDPDRAEKAGCDAVVTKPFESQSLIHKVEELIEKSRNSSAPPPMFEPSQSVGTMPTDGVFADQSFGEQSFDEPPASQVPAWPPLTSVSAPDESIDDSPFESESRPSASSRSNFGTSDPFSASAPKSFTPEPSFRSHGEELFAAEPKTAPEPSMPFEKPRETPSPFASDSSSSFADKDSKGFSAETRALPKMSFDDLKKIRDESSSAPPVSSAPSAPAWPEPDLSDEIPTGRWPAPASKSSSAPASKSSRPAPPTEEQPAPSPFSFDDENEPVPSKPAAQTSPFAPSASFGSESSWAPSSTASAPPKSSPPPAPAPAATASSSERPAASSSPSWTSKAAESATPSTEPRELSDAQVDRIARKVIELMSDQVVKSIAWEVIPDLAEIVVRERIKELEEEAN